MRVDIKSKNKFNLMLKRLFNNDEIPLIMGCSINSKNINKGDMFFPLKGKYFDGHNATVGGAVITKTESVDELIRFVQNSTYRNPFFVIFAPFESPDSQLSNGAKIMKNGVLYLEL